MRMRIGLAVAALALGVLGAAPAAADSCDDPLRCVQQAACHTAQDALDRTAVGSGVVHCLH